MNVGCPECGTIFRVDPAKVPVAGIRARCSVCGGVMAIGESGRIDDDFTDAARAASPAAAAPAAPRPSFAPPAAPSAAAEPPAGSAGTMNPR